LLLKHAVPRDARYTSWPALSRRPAGRESAWRGGTSRR
jgi:hypothetical protein